MREWTIHIKDEQDTERVADQLAALCFPGAIIAMDGDLGAGKTRLTRSIAKGLGIEANVNSPTFTIIKEYEGRKLPLYHMDVYRISEEEAAELGLEEYFEGDGVSIVEWASRIENLLPPERLEIYIEVTGAYTRQFILKAYGERYETWIKTLKEQHHHAKSDLRDHEVHAQDFYWLALDTATATMTNAVMNHLQTVAASDSDVERNHSVKLIPEIERLLNQAGIRMKQIRAIATGRGPGSYTGVRISVTVAKTLAWSLNIPVISVSSLAALAWGYVRSELEQNEDALFANKSVWLIPVLDARRGQVFTGLYSLLPEEADVGTRMIINDLTLKWRELEGDRILPFQDWLQRIQNRYGRTVDGEIPGRIVFVGELGKFAEAVTQFKRAMELPITTQERTIHAPDIAWLAWNRLNRGESDDVHSLQPNYTQLAEAEQKLLSRQK